MSAEAYGEFLVRIFDRWIGLDDLTIEIRFPENLLVRLMGGKATVCQLEGTCDLFITVD